MKKMFFCLFLILAMLTSMAFAEAEQPSAAVRHGTLIVRIPDSFIADKLGSLRDGVIPWDNGEITTSSSKEMERIAISLLSSADYQAMRKDADDGNTDTYEGRLASAEPKDFVCIMNTRHVGNAWYTVVRLKDAMKGKQKLDCSINTYDLKVTKGNLRCALNESFVGSIDVDIRDLNDQGPLWSKGPVTLYDISGAHLMVIVAPRDSFGNDERADLYIGGERIPLWTFLSCYQSADGNNIFCAVLTDDEVNTLEQLAADDVYPELTTHKD